MADLDKPEGAIIRSSLDSFLSYQIPQSVKTSSDLSDHPQCFNLVMSMVIINDLKGQQVRPFSQLEIRVQELLQNEHVKHLINLFHDDPADRELVETLYQAIQKS